MKKTKSKSKDETANKRIPIKKSALEVFAESAVSLVDAVVHGIQEEYIKQNPYSVYILEKLNLYMAEAEAEKSEETIKPNSDYPDEEEYADNLVTDSGEYLAPDDFKAFLSELSCPEAIEYLHAAIGNPSQKLDLKQKQDRYAAFNLLGMKLRIKDVLEEHNT